MKSLKRQKANHRKLKKTKLNIADELFGCVKDGPMQNMTDAEIMDSRTKDFYGMYFN